MRRIEHGGIVGEPRIKKTVGFGKQREERTLLDERSTYMLNSDQRMADLRSWWIHMARVAAKRP